MISRLAIMQAVQRARQSGFHYLAAGILAAFPECFPGLAGKPVPTFDRVSEPTTAREGKTANEYENR